MADAPKTPASTPKPTGTSTGSPTKTTTDPKLDHSKDEKVLDTAHQDVRAAPRDLAGQSAKSPSPVNNQMGNKAPVREDASVEDRKAKSPRDFRRIVEDWAERTFDPQHLPDQTKVHPTVHYREKVQDLIKDLEGH